MSTTPELLARAARDRGDDLAISDGDERISCAELALRVRDLARGLCAAGIGRGDAVALWAPNSWQWIVTALAVHTVGGVLVPINTRYKAPEAKDVIARSRAKLVFTVDEFLGCRYGELVDGIVDWGRSLPRGELRARVEPDDVGDVMFTSGTTGRAKGVPATHAQTLRAFGDWAEIVGLRRGDRYLVVVPFFHSFGYKAGWLAALMAGATIYPQPVFDVDQVLARVERERITVLPGPPTLYHSLLGRSGDLSSLRLAVTGAANVPVELVRRMRAELGFETVLTGYGLTESTGVATLCRAGDDPETVATTSGRAMPGVEVRIADDGEVLVRGYNVMRGYLDSPEDHTVVDGWLHTGDIGALDARGNLRITDRKKDMFIVGGFNAYPAEIEGVLLTHPAIAQVAVVGAPDDRLGEVGVAFVVARAACDAACDDAALTAWCRERMANYKVPRRFELVDALPTNASGKVLKTELRARVMPTAGPGRSQPPS
jgi:acyl-CoA synthetase (AMP-forming)/AMP-acid ligase II